MSKCVSVGKRQGSITSGAGDALLVLMMLVAKNKLLGHKAVNVKYVNFDRFTIKEYI